MSEQPSLFERYAEFPESRPQGAGPSAYGTGGTRSSRGARILSPAPTYPARGQRPRREFFERLVHEMKQSFDISIRKWRQSMSGVAYELHYSNGDVKRMISAPHPRSPVSACIFLHEVGHHAIGFRKFRPRCLEEYHVWQWAFGQMRSRGIPIDLRVERHYRRSMHHYVCLAKKRGLRHIPPELMEFQSPPS